MIYETEGDIILTRAPVIVHGVAPNDHFSSGLALRLRSAFPSMFKDFRHYGQQTHAGPGDLWVWSGAGPAGGVRIVSLLTQSGGYEHGARPGRASLENVNHCLKKLRRWIDDERPGPIAIPRLATGVGGLEWERVYPLIKQHLEGVPSTVIVYTVFREGERAREPEAATV